MTTVCHHSASFMMPIGDPGDDFFYPTLTLMIDFYILGHQIRIYGVFTLVRSHIPVLARGRDTKHPAARRLDACRTWIHDFVVMLKLRHHVSQFSVFRIFWNDLENRSFRNRENLQYKKTAGWGLLSLFIKTNGKCNNSHAPITGFSGIQLSVRTQSS